LEVEKLNDELSALRATIEDLKDILANESRVLEIIRGDLTEIKSKYPSPRKSEISVDYGNIDDEDLIDREDVVITITHGGYIKRLPVEEYKAQGRGGKGITAHRPKDEDYVEKMFVCCTHDPILLFSSKGKVYSIKGYEIPEANRTARGRAIVNVVQLDQGEKIEAVLPVLEDGTGYLVMATEKGLIKKTHTDEFKRIAKNGKIAIKLQEDDRLIAVRFTTGEDEILVASRGGKCIRFSEKDVRPTGRGTQGVKAITLGKEDIVVDMLIIDPNFDLFTLTSLGYGKRSKIDDYRLQSRGGKGIKAGVFNEKTGHLVNLKAVNDENDIMIITVSGIIIRMHADTISCIGRSTRGVRVMNVKESEVATVDVTERDDEAEVEAPEETAADLSPEELAEGADETEEIEEEVVLDDEMDETPAEE
jgi:DNA gyrase subunit A